MMYRQRDANTLFTGMSLRGWGTAWTSLNNYKQNCHVPQYPTPGCIYKGNEVSIQICLWTHVYCSLFIIAKIQNRPVNRQTDKAKRVFIYNGVLLLSLKEWALVICTEKKMGVARGHLHKISQTQKNKCHVFSVIHENCKREKRSYD